MTDTERTPQLTRRGVLRRLGHSAAGLALALVLPPLPSPPWSPRRGRSR